MPNLRKFNREVRRTLMRVERGERSVVNQIDDRIAKVVPRDVRALIVAENYDEARAAIREAIAARDPWAVLAWMKAAGVIDQTGQQIIREFLAAMGVLPEQAESYIARGQAADAGAENPLDAAERFVDALVVLCEAHPECRRIVARLGSYAVVEGTEAG